MKLINIYIVGRSFSVSGRFAPKVYLGNWPSVLLQLKKAWTTTVYKLTLQALQALHQGAWKEMHYQALLTSSSSAAALDGIGLAWRTTLHCIHISDIPTFITTVPPSLPFLHPSWRCLYLTSWQACRHGILVKSWMFNSLEELNAQCNHWTLGNHWKP